MTITDWTKIMKTLALFFILPLACTTGVARSQSAPLCISHFNNQSNYRWTIYNFDGKKGVLFVPPHAVVAIRWGVTTNVTISGETPQQSFKQQFSIQQMDSCVAFQLEGSAGPITLNKPANGDVTTCAGGC